jgi:hypothetical protein
MIFIAIIDLFLGVIGLLLAFILLIEIEILSGYGIRELLSIGSYRELTTMILGYM